MNARALIFLLLGAGNAFAQGFAGLGMDAEGFAVPEPGKRFAFPQDHGAHPDYRIEWWYLTANLTGPNGADYGLQWTLFRSALAPGEAKGWESPQIWLGHAAVTSAETHLATERFARGGIGQAGVTAEPFAAWIDDWQMAGDTLDRLRLAATGKDFAYDIAMHAEGPLVLHGNGGYSVKSAKGQASYYYSQPFLHGRGNDHAAGGGGRGAGHRVARSRVVVAAPGEGPGRLGLVLALLRHRREADGLSAYAIPRVATSPPPHGSRPVVQRRPTAPVSSSRPRWRRAGWKDATSRPAGASPCPTVGSMSSVGALNPQAWMGLGVPYWEGPVRVTGTHPGKGYLEMTGYERQ